MASLECETQIHLLPDEVLCLIFDRLDKRNVKNASLTCRKWHDIIFLSAYIRRFKLGIFFDYSTNEEQCAEFTLQGMEKVIDIVKHTQRCYRHMSFHTFHSSTDVEFLPFWESIHPKITENIDSLKLQIRDCFSKSDILVILDGIRLMPKLRSLSFQQCSELGILPTVKSATVKHLKMDGWNIIPFDMPELQSFQGSLYTLLQPDQPLVYANLKHVTLTHSSIAFEEKAMFVRLAQVQMPELQSYKGPLYVLAVLDNIAQPLVLPKLRRVTLTDGRMRLEDRSILHRLSQVETLQLLFSSIDDWLLPAICETCTALKNLYFNWNRVVIHPAILRPLSKFTNLRQLVFGPIYMNHLVPFDFDLSNLTQLELLNLGSHLLEAPNLMCLPKSVRFLTVHITNTNEARVIETVISSLPQLQKLRLVYPGRQVFAGSLTLLTVGKQILKMLYQLKRLEVLVFENAKIGESAFLDMEAPMHQTRELLFVHCELDRNRICGCREMFPNLKKMDYPRMLPPYYFSKQIE